MNATRQQTIKIVKTEVETLVIEADIKDLIFNAMDGISDMLKDAILSRDIELFDTTNEIAGSVKNLQEAFVNEDQTLICQLRRLLTDGCLTSFMLNDVQGEIDEAVEDNVPTELRLFINGTRVGTIEDEHIQF